MRNDLRPGQIVVSTAGRDRGRLMVVLARLDERFVLVADGGLRKSVKPKKKNIRHLRAQGKIDEKVSRRMQMRQQVSDQDLREALAPQGNQGVVADG